MFTKNVKRAGRGRPRGESAKGAAARQRLYAAAVALIAKHGYEAATLRDVASEAGVSAGLLYRYFPNKRAVVLAFYDELSALYARQAMNMRPGKWRERFVFALRTSLEVLAPHRTALQALIPVLVSAGDEGLFASGTAFSRARVQRVFEEAVTGATDAPARALAESLGRVLYLGHVMVLLWWLLDKTPRQRATAALLALFEQMLPSLALTLRLPMARRFVIAGDGLIREALFDEPAAR
jgi:AcrR family transcriptional regulator